MGLRSTAMLEQDFPVATTAELVASYQKLDYLTREGFLGDPFDYQSILPWLGAAMATLAETFAAPTAAYTGAAGTTSRYYAVVPTYPLEYPEGAASAPAGKYLSFLGGKPPYGYPASSAVASAQNTFDGTRRLYGPVSPITTVADCAAALAANAYVTVTTPAAKNIPGVLFDIVSSDDAGNYFLVAAGVAPGTTFEDTGSTALLPSNSLYGAKYTPRAYPEIGYDGWTATLTNPTAVGATSFTIGSESGSPGPEPGDTVLIDTGANQESIVVGTYSGGIITTKDEEQGAKYAHSAGAVFSNGGKVVYGSLTR